MIWTSYYAKYTGTEGISVSNSMPAWHQCKRKVSELMCIEYQVGEYNACFDALARIVNSCSESLQALAEAFMRVGEALREVFCTDIEEAYLPKQSQKRATKELVCKLVEEPKLDKRKGIQKNVRNHRY